MNEQNKKTIAENLSRIMDRRNITQARLAEELGVGQSIISQWRNGSKTPRAERLQDIAKILNCSISELTGEPEQETEQEYINRMYRAYGALFQAIDSLPEDEKKQAENFIAFLKKVNHDDN